jgi:hypothetical protein
MHEWHILLMERYTCSFQDPSSSSNMHESHILLMKLTTSPNWCSARLALPGPEDKSIVSSSVPIVTERNPAAIFNPMPLPPPENNSLKETGYESRTCEPIIEEPATPEQECLEMTESDIEDSFYEDPDEIPTIKLNIEEFTINLQNYMQEKMELQEGDMSNALVALNPEAASIPTPKLKNVSRLRTEHQV